MEVFALSCGLKLSRTGQGRVRESRQPWPPRELDFASSHSKMSATTRHDVWRQMKSLRVLIADDDGLTLMVLRKILVTMGHTVVGEAGDGQQAVALAREANPDLIILDIRMPKMDGLEAARQIRDRCPVPIIVLSAHTEAGLGAVVPSSCVNGALDTH